MDTVTLNEEEGEETFGDEDRAFELVTGTHKNPHYSEVYRRNTRDRLHVKTDVRTITAEDTMSAMQSSWVRLKSRCLVSSITKYSRNKSWRAVLSFLLSASPLPETGDDTCLQGERQAT